MVHKIRRDRCAMTDYMCAFKGTASRKNERKNELCLIYNFGTVLIKEVNSQATDKT